MDDMQDPAALLPEDVPELDAEEQASVDEAWEVEIARRVADVRAGRVKPVSWEEAEARIRAMLAKRHG